MIYDTDTAHCEGNGCKKKETCLRYHLHQMREKLQPIYVYSYTAPMYKNGECELFYPIGK